MRQGRSGAIVRHEGGNEVVKWAPAGQTQGKLFEQGEWLRAHGRRHKFLPQRVNLTEQGYSMEKLVPMPTFVDDYALTLSLYDKLQGLWSEEVEYTFDSEQHVRYVHERTADMKLGPNLVSWFREVHRVAFADMKPVLTHGDPTWDNCMLSRKGELKVIDPVPADDRLPSVRARDVGKIIQSICGYEAIIGARRAPTMTLAKLRLGPAVGLPEVEWQASLYMAAVHFALLRRYTPEHDEAWIRIIGRLLDLRDDSWT